MSAMSQEQKLCRYFICKGENPELGGKLVSMNTFRRHRKKELGWSVSTLDDSEHIEPANSLLEER